VKALSHLLRIRKVKECNRNNVINLNIIFDDKKRVKNMCQKKRRKKLDEEDVMDKERIRNTFLH